MSRTRLTLSAVARGALGVAVLFPACTSEPGAPTPNNTAGSGGANSAGSSGKGGAAQAGKGGASPSGGSAGSGAGVPAAGTSASPAGGMAGSGGESVAGSAGSGAGAGGATAGGGSGGASGAGAGMAGTSASMGGAGCGDSFVSDVDIQVHPDVNMLLNVSWTQMTAAEQVWLEFDFEDGNVMRSRAKPGTAGAHTDVVIGVPGDTDVNVRIVSRQAGVECATTSQVGHTDPVPGGMPVPTILAYDEELSTPDRYLFGAVEDSDGGSTQGYYLSTFWLYIMDKQGRIVWYYADPATLATSSFQRRARDGGYIWIEKRCFGCSGFTESVLKMTLDHTYEEEIEVPNLADCIDVTDDGTLLFDRSNQLWEMSADGEDFRMIFDCEEHFADLGEPNWECYTNTINWNPADDTVLMSYPYPRTVIQVQRSDGQVVGTYGEGPGSYAFAAPLSMPPNAWGFGFQHFPNISADGTLMVSSHMPGYTDFETTPTPNQHAFLEFTIDRDNEQLIEKWRYTGGTEWPRAKGMAIRLANGNTLGNYGTGGAIREVTADKQLAFHVKWDAEGGNDAYNKMVGNNEFIDDLYALNVGGPGAQ